MKHQQVVVDYVYMLKSSCTCLALAFSGYIFLKLIQAIFWLPGHLRNNQERLYKELRKKTNTIETDIDYTIENSNDHKKDN